MTPAANAAARGPARRQRRGTRRQVVANVAINAEYRHLVLQAAPPATEAAPGQFFQLLCPAPPGDAPFLRRPMSVYGADPAAGEVAFLYKVTGAGTAGLATLAPGDTLEHRGSARPRLHA